jgi:4-hydroxybenzoate polyprenyltransferase
MSRHPTVLGIVFLSVAILVAAISLKHYRFIERFTAPADGVGTPVPAPAVKNDPSAVTQILFVAMALGFVAIGYAAFKRSG